MAKVTITIEDLAADHVEVSIVADPSGPKAETTPATMIAARIADMVKELLVVKPVAKREEGKSH